MRIRKTGLLLFVLILQTLAFADSSRFSIQMPNEPVSLDPSFAEDGVGLYLLNNTSAGLVGYNEKGELKNLLAEEIMISKDHKSFDVTLKKGAFWSDGKPIQISDFLTSFRRFLGPKSTSKLAPLFFAIRGAQAYHQGKAGNSDLGVLEKAGKLHFDLEEPCPYFVQLLTLPLAFPLRQDILDQNQGRWPLNAPVSGPYTIQTYQIGQKLILERNSKYFVAPAKTAIVEVLFIPDESTAMNLFRQGRLDILTRVSSLDLPGLKKKGLIQTHPFSATYYLSFNCRKPPFNQSKWRRAVAGSIRRDEIVSLLDSWDQAAWSWIPFGFEGFEPYQNPGKVFSQDVNEIKTAKKSDFKIQAGFDFGDRNSRIMEKVQQDLNQYLNLQISLIHYDWKTYLQTLKTDPPQIFRMGWLAPFKDSIPHLKAFTSTSLNNYSGCASPAYDQVVAEVEKLPPGPARLQKIKKAQKILLEDEAMVIPIFHYAQNIGVSKRIHGFKANEFGVIPFNQISVDAL